MKVHNEVESEKKGQFKSLKEEAQTDTRRETISKKHTAIREINRKQPSDNYSNLKDIISSTVDSGNLQSEITRPSSGLVSKWESMKSGFQNLTSNLGTRRFLPLGQSQENKDSSSVSSSESLDEIFQRLKRPTLDHRDFGDDEDL